jgi:hypothetical protein
MNDQESIALGPDGGRQEANGISPRKDRQPRGHDRFHAPLDGDFETASELDADRQKATERKFKAIGELYALHWQALLAVARNRLARRRVPPVDYNDDDAVQSSMRTFLEQMGPCTANQIANQLGVSRRTIHRRLEQIRVIWEQSGLLEVAGACDRLRTTP